MKRTSIVYVVLVIALMGMFAFMCGSETKADVAASQPGNVAVVQAPSLVTTPIVRYRAWSAVRPAVVRTPVVQSAPVQVAVVQAPQPSAVVFEQRPATAYTVVEQPREPWVTRGVFRDRVVIPRRAATTLVVQ